MFVRLPAGAARLLLILATSPFAAAHAADQCDARPARPLAFGQVVEASPTAGRCRFGLGTEFATDALYRLHLPAATAIELELDANFQTALRIVDGNGKLVVDDSDARSKEPRRLKLPVTLRAGTYLATVVPPPVWLKSPADGPFRYRLSLRKRSVAPAPDAGGYCGDRGTRAPTRLVPDGASAGGTLDIADCFAASSYQDDYALKLGSRRVLDIEASGNGMDLRVDVRAVRGEWPVKSDRERARNRFRGELPAGDYVVSVSAGGHYASGAYTLNARTGAAGGAATRSPRPCTSAAPFTLGGTVKGEAGSGSCTVATAAGPLPAALYLLRLDAPATVEAELRTSGSIMALGVGPKSISRDASDPGLYRGTIALGAGDHVISVVSALDSDFELSVRRAK